MRVKILRALTVCLITLVVLSPEIAVFNVICQRHTELVKTQNLSCYALANIKFSNFTFIQQVQMGIERYQIVTVLQWFFLFTPIGLGLGIIVYDRYLVYRAAVLKEQIEMLERLWQQSIEQ